MNGIWLAIVTLIYAYASSQLFLIEQKLVDWQLWCNLVNQDWPDRTQVVQDYKQIFHSMA